MSAEMLREAASVLRERAEAALKDEATEPWMASPMLDPDNNGWYVGNHIPEADWDTTVAHLPYDYEGKVAPYIATVHPAVGLALADWLIDAEQYFGHDTLMDRGAVAVAAAILGRSI